MRTVLTIVSTTYGGHDKSTRVRVYASAQALLPALRRELAAHPGLPQELADQLDTMDLDQLFDAAEQANALGDGDEVEVQRTVLYETPEEAEAEITQR